MTGRRRRPAPALRRASLVVPLGVICAIAIAGCGASASVPPLTTPTSSASAVASSDSSGLPSASALPSPSDLEASDAVRASPVTGVVVSVDSAGLSKVSAFTLRLPDGSQQAFRIGVLENGAQFPPGHLAEHLATAAPVRVFYRPEGGELVVYRIEDAG